MIFSDIT